MVWGAILGTIGSALISSESSDDAAEAQLGATRIASDTERYMFDRATALQEPWREAGMEGLNYLQHYLGIGQPTSIPKPERESFDNFEDYQNALRNWETQNERFQGQFGLAMQGPEDYEASPYYNFLLEEGTNALTNQAAARGRLGSGSYDKAIMRYGQNLASQDYGNWLSRNMQQLRPYQSLSGTGQTTAGMMGGQAMNLGTSLANNQLYAGGAQAQNYINQGNIWGNAVTGLGNLGMTYAMQPQYTAGDYSNVGIY